MGLQCLRSCVNSCSVCDGPGSPWTHLVLTVSASHGAQSTASAWGARGLSTRHMWKGMLWKCCRCSLVKLLWSKNNKGSMCLCSFPLAFNRAFSLCFQNHTTQYSESTVPSYFQINAFIEYEWLYEWLCICVSLYSTFFFPSCRNLSKLVFRCWVFKGKSRYCVSLTQDDDSTAAESCIMEGQA